ncbi:MAG: xylose isomerase [Acidimicrobiales bacterium]
MSAFPEFFDGVGPVRYAGPDSDDPLTFRWYDADRVVAGRRMEDHLRMAVCYWHSFVWPGSDVFGDGTLDRPWISAACEPMEAARWKMSAAFEFFAKLGTPFFCFHDRDIAPAGSTFAETCARLDAMVDEALAHMERTGVRLLWGTANLFSHPRYAAGAATNPDPEVFAHAAAQVCHALEATHRMEGANYVLWGGREGYDTLLNTDLAREEEQLARFLHLVVEHKHRIGFTGPILVEPKPSEPAEHQYDRDAATVGGFLARHGLEGEVLVNLEANHATLAGHSLHHEVATALAAGIFGSLDGNRGDPQNGWDTDQFPTSVEECTLVLYEILAAGGFASGGINFDTKLRRQSVSRDDLFHAHVGAVDTMARSLLAAASLLESGELAGHRDSRYAGWRGPLGSDILGGTMTLDELHRLVLDEDLDPTPVSGRQELLENTVNRHIGRVR